MTEGNCAILEFWGSHIYLRGLHVPCARLSGATASFSVHKGSWLVVTAQVKPAGESARRVYSGGVSIDPCSRAHRHKKEARRTQGDSSKVARPT